MISNSTIHSVNIITLGCYKNLVDSEYLIKQLQSNGIEVVFDSNEFKDLIIINTCGFILDAKKESIDTIMQWINAKEKNKIKKIYVIGCLTERYKDSIKIEIPEIDEIFGVNSIKDILSKIKLQYNESYQHERLITTPSHFAYLKIAEGCNHNCTFCAIPLIRGKYLSKKMDDIIKEAEILVEHGVKEIILIAQDLTYYGKDLYKKQSIVKLIDKLSNIKNLELLRLNYSYPTNFPLDLIDLMSEKDNICNYLDIPFQHASEKVLNKMKRGHSKKDMYNLIEYCRKIIPDIALRTTFLVGHPGEGKKEFKELYDFIKEIRFDRLGVFTYSEEEDTFSASNFKDSITSKIKQQRSDEIMNMQQIISTELNSKKVGRTLKVIIDKKESEYYIGRSQYDSPEVDNEILIKTSNILSIGGIYSTKIIDSSEYDLFGSILKQ